MRDFSDYFYNNAAWNNPQMLSYCQKLFYNIFIDNKRCIWKSTEKKVTFNSVSFTKIMHKQL